MKTNPTESILAARKNFTICEKDLQASVSMLARSQEQINHMAVNSDLGTVEVLREISQLQTLADVLPIRIAALEKDMGVKESGLVAAVNNFIREELGPRARQARGHAREAVLQELKPHIANPALLDASADTSEKVIRFDSLQVSITESPMEGAMNYAQNALDAWSRFAELEAQQS